MKNMWNTDFDKIEELTTEEEARFQELNSDEKLDGKYNKAEGDERLELTYERQAAMFKRRAARVQEDIDDEIKDDNETRQLQLKMLANYKRQAIRNYNKYST